MLNFGWNYFYTTQIVNSVNEASWLLRLILNWSMKFVWNLESQTHLKIMDENGEKMKWGLTDLYEIWLCSFFMAMLYIILCNCVSKSRLFLTQIGSVTVYFSAQRAVIIQNLDASCHQFNEITYCCQTISLWVFSSHSNKHNVSCFTIWKKRCKRFLFLIID